MIDQHTLNLSGVAKRRIDSGELDVKTAISVIKHCKAHNVDFEEGYAAVNQKPQ